MKIIINNGDIMNNKLIYGILLIVVVGCGVLFALNNNSITQPETNIDESQLQKADNNTVTDDVKLENKLYTIDKSDTNALLVENNSTTSITSSLINKTGNTTENGDSVDFYGTNSAILIKSGSQLDIKNSKIITNSSGSNAIFVTNAEDSGNNQGTQPESNPASQSNPPSMPGGGQGGQPPEASGNQPPEGNGGQQNDNLNPQDNSNQNYSSGGANATIENVEINTYQDKSRGLDATYGGNINATNVKINTRGSSCAALATDRGEGTVNVKNSQINIGVDNSTGKGSPCIYSTGNITVENTNGTAYNSQISCIEGKNSITMKDCMFNCFATGNREENGEYVDLGGIFIYQSMSGDANIGTATFNVSGSKLSIDESSQYYKTAPMIHTTNTQSIINLQSTTFEFGSNVFLEASGQNQWGNTGSNGADVNLTTTDEKITGDIIVDSISTLNYTLSSTDYTGTINSNQTIGQTNIIINEGSTWTLTGDSHISSLENKGTINYGDYTLYVDGQAYNKDNPFK